MICTTLGAAALGELLPGDRENAIGKLLAAGASVLMIATSSIAFATAQMRENVDPGSIAAISLSFFVGTLLAAASCMFYSHREAR